eukprot:TRINITY_DN4435_c0_g1_i8.p3 TRINITY_DN4435_c0_g1~~TRINITY_DN4435_c0_g1_i8.p3  ORF type:complete len:139 (-),score=2.56 TRINITY_DN4435_c0_g1_i8:151-567(-)
MVIQQTRNIFYLVKKLDVQKYPLNTCTLFSILYIVLQFAFRTTQSYEIGWLIIWHILHVQFKLLQTGKYKEQNQEIYFEILWLGLILKKGGRTNQSRKYKEQNQEYISKFCGKAQFQKKEVQLDKNMRLITVAIVLYY